MKFYFILISTLISIIFYSCTYSPKNSSVTDYNTTEKGREKVFADTNKIQSNSLLDIFYKDERQDRTSYDLILKKGKTDFNKFGLLRAFEIECLIPRTKTEFSLFYNGYLTEKESDSCRLFYHYCDSLFSICH